MFVSFIRETGRVGAWKGVGESVTKIFPKFRIFCENYTSFSDFLKLFRQYLEKIITYFGKILFYLVNFHYCTKMGKY